MKTKILPRATLAVLALAAFSVTACDTAGHRPDRDDRGGWHEPPERWPHGGWDHDRGDRGGRDHDRDHGHDHDRGDHDRGGRDHDRGHERHEAAAVSSLSSMNERMSKTLSSFDETNAGKMFDGSK